MNSDTPKKILFTAFEPSGDSLASAATAGLLATDPTIELFGLGGTEMEDAGVELLASTTHEAKMGLGAISEIMRIAQLVDVARVWMEEHQPNVVVAVDSPAANWSVCKAAKGMGIHVVHLAAPQLWAWAPWRIKKMKRLSDHVMCLLPFEPEWFTSRGMPATFIGHPAMCTDETTNLALPDGTPRIVLLPGSRKNEITKNLPMQQAILQRIAQNFPTVEAVIACRREDVDRVKPYANDVQIVASELPSVLEWADLALTVSGTVSLHVMRHTTPMIGMYKANALTRLLSKFVLTTPYRMLPNLIASKQIVPEFIPCGNIAKQIGALAVELLRDEEALHEMQLQLHEETALYATHDPAKEAAEIILRFA
ncbi:MAG: hypothetical protein QGI78_03085 [Phycisphaerales bacterium]|jgi:lipid-A-disaccharide synthase|nr:hypothetical protein [Phycisphaerales bacterium]